MQQKTTVERVLHYIGRTLRKDADGNEVISKHHAELAVRMAFEGGRQSVVENIPELEWKTVNEYNVISKTPFGRYSIRYKTRLLYGGVLIKQTKCIKGAIQAANEDYKQRIKQALGL